MASDGRVDGGSHWQGYEIMRNTIISQQWNKTSMNICAVVSTIHRVYYTLYCAIQPNTYSIHANTHSEFSPISTNTTQHQILTINTVSFIPLHTTYVHMHTHMNSQQSIANIKPMPSNVEHNISKLSSSWYHNPERIRGTDESRVNR